MNKGTGETLSRTSLLVCVCAVFVYKTVITLTSESIIIKKID